MNISTRDDIRWVLWMIMINNSLAVFNWNSYWRIIFAWLWNMYCSWSILRWNITVWKARNLTIIAFNRYISTLSALNGAFSYLIASRVSEDNASTTFNWSIRFCCWCIWFILVISYIDIMWLSWISWLFSRQPFVS